MHVLITAASRRVPLVQAIPAGADLIASARPRGGRGRQTRSPPQYRSPIVPIEWPLVHETECLYPRVANDAPENRTRNRRVDVVILEASS
jgi:hypothetical protein